MATVAESLPIRCTMSPLSALDVDLVALPWFEGEPLGAFSDLNNAASGELDRALSSREFLARPFDLFLAPISDAKWKPRRVLLVGAGAAASFNPCLARHVATVA